MALSHSALRQRIATALDGLTGWYESLGPASEFPYGDSRPKAHKLFSVEIVSCSFGEGRQRTTEEQYVSTSVEVRVAWRTRSQSTIADSDAGLDGVQEAIKAMLAVSSDELTLTVNAMRRERDPSNDWFIAAIEMEARHMYAIR